MSNYEMKDNKKLNQTSLYTIVLRLDFDFNTRAGKNRWGGGLIFSGKKVCGTGKKSLCGGWWWRVGV